MGLRLQASDVGMLDADLAQRLAPSAGLRNAVVHDYLDIDLGLLAKAVPEALEDYAAFVRQASTWLANDQSEDREDDTEV